MTLGRNLVRIAGKSGFAYKLDSAYHALIELAIGIGAGGGAVAQGKGVAAALQRKGRGGGKAVAVVEDYKTGVAVDVKTGEKTALDYPSSNVIILILENKDKVIIRPSGTEPKIKIYAMVQGNNEDEAKAQTEIYKNDIMKVLGIGE